MRVCRCRLHSQPAAAAGARGGSGRSQRAMHGQDHLRSTHGGTCCRPSRQARMHAHTQPASPPGWTPRKRGRLPIGVLMRWRGRRSLVARARAGVAGAMGTVKLRLLLVGGGLVCVRSGALDRMDRCSIWRVRTGPLIARDHQPGHRGACSCHREQRALLPSMHTAPSGTHAIPSHLF